jgi:hypothetical protein
MRAVSTTCGVTAADQQPSETSPKICYEQYAVYCIHIGLARPPRLPLLATSAFVPEDIPIFGLDDIRPGRTPRP